MVAANTPSPAPPGLAVSSAIGTVTAAASITLYVIVAVVAGESLAETCTGAPAPGWFGVAVTCVTVAWGVPSTELGARGVPPSTRLAAQASAWELSAARSVSSSEGPAPSGATDQGGASS